MYRRIAIALIALIAAAALVAITGCQTGESLWAPCSPSATGNPTGTDGTWVLLCKDGRWEPSMTVREFVAIRQGQKVDLGPLPTPTTTTTTTTTTPPASDPTTTAPPTVEPALAAGYDHTCALLADRTVTCWGGNYFGQLGSTTNNGTDDPNPTPIPVAGLTNVTAITAGGYHTCALIEGGTVTCWGQNRYGQLGNSTNNGDADNHPNPTPTAVAGLTHVTALTAGGMHTCALIEGGTVTCWGHNRFGQLGNDANNDIDPPGALPTPTPVAGVDHVTALTAGNWFTCALIEGGTVSCWGLNLRGQLGSATNNDNQNANPSPASIAGLGGVTGLTAGYEHTCALITGGAVKCWGVNAYGQLGNPNGTGAFSANPDPALVVGLPAVSALAAGGEFTCALLDTGSADCWGFNLLGQLGNATNSGVDTSNPSPLAVTGLTGIATLAASATHTCVILDGGGVRCWGENSKGQLGNDTNSGTATANPTPLPVTGF